LASATWFRNVQLRFSSGRISPGTNNGPQRKPHGTNF